MRITLVIPMLLCAALPFGQHALAKVTAEEAAQIGDTLTPMGAEMAGNAEGTIPAWSGVYDTPLAGYTDGGRRPDPFADEKPLYSVTAKNLPEHADKLSVATQEMIKRYPETYRVDVYPTHRTGGAPDWVYANTKRNATRAELAPTDNGPMVKNAYGGIPFPIPQAGEEVMWNSMLNWRGQSTQTRFRSYLITSDGRPVMTVEATGSQQMPYYFKEGNLDGFDGVHTTIRLLNSGPSIRAGEGIVGQINMDPERDVSYTYLPGQRRVRRLPNACCDTPAPATAGISTFDELNVYSGPMGRFDWRIVGKKEMLVPYNTNRSFVPNKDTDLIGAKHLNPDHVRWELHRVWVVEATIAPGKRHVAAKSTYYLDEDTWLPLLAERYDAKGNLWKSLWMLPLVMPDLPGVYSTTWGFNDLISDTWFISGVMNEQPSQFRIVDRYPESHFSSSALAAQGVR